MAPAKQPGRTLTIVVACLVAASIRCGRSEPTPEQRPAPSQPITYVPDTKPVPEAHWADASVPKGTVLKLSLIDGLGSATTSRGENFRCLVTDAIRLKDFEPVPSGSNVMGTVRNVVRASPGFKGRGGMIQVEFDRIGTPTGASATLKARLTGVKSARSSAVLAGPAEPGGIVAGVRDEELVLEPTTPLTVVLEEPLQIKVRQ